MLTGQRHRLLHNVRDWRLINGKLKEFIMLFKDINL